MRKARLFELWRKEDGTGVSGTGLVAVGMEAPDGQVAFRWCAEGKPKSWVIHENIGAVMEVHGHGGKTGVVWIESAEAPREGGPWAVGDQVRLTKRMAWQLNKEHESGG